MFNRVSKRGLPGWLFALAVVFCFALGVNAQEVPFTGQINQDNVTLRAGAGTPYYIVGNAGKGTRVVVSERIADWYKISPPPGIYSYVSKAFVDVRGDGSTGTATQRLSSYAASVNGPGESYRRQLELLTGDVVKIVAQEGSYFKIEPPKGAYVYVQTQYITPVEEVITPESAPESAPEAPATPKAPATEAPSAPAAPSTPATPAPRQPSQPTTTQTPAQTATQTPSQPRTDRVIEAVTEQQTSQTPTQTPAQPQTPAAPATPSTPATPVETAAVEQPATTSPVETAAAAPSTPSTTATPAAPAPPRNGNAASAQPVEVVVDEPVASAETRTTEEKRPLVVSPDLLAAEQAFYEAQKLPVEKQPLDRLLEQYQQVQTNRSLTAGDQRVLSVRISQIQRNMTLAKAINDLREVRKELQPSTTILVPPPPAPQRGNYDAMGVLLASSVYDGQTLPRLYRLVTSGEGRTIAYIRPTGSFDVAEALGSTVGIQGQTRYDTALKIRVIDAQQLVILEPAVAR